MCVRDPRLFVLARECVCVWVGAWFTCDVVCTVPNGTKGEPYLGFNHSLDCGDNINMQGGCLFNVREDPNELIDLALELPDVLHSLKARYLELRATAYDQVTPMCKAGIGVSSPGHPSKTDPPCPKDTPFITEVSSKYVDAVRNYRGFQGPFWGQEQNKYGSM